MRMRLTHVALVGLLLIPGVGDAAAQVMRWQVDGETRDAIVYAPASARGEPAPLVLSFHGFGDNMQNFQYTNLHVAWPDAIVVYFQGLERRGGLLGWQVERGGRGDRDLRLVDVALASLRETYSVDDDRIYATGYSNGGMFAYLLWAERPDEFAAYAPVAAPPPPLGAARATPARLSRGRGERPGGPLFGSGSRDRRRHRGERRRGDDPLRSRLHGIRRGHGGAGHDLDPCRRPRLPARDQRADRRVLSRAFPRALIDRLDARHAAIRHSTDALLPQRAWNRAGGRDVLAVETPIEGH